MAILLSGKEVVFALNEQLAKRVQALKMRDVQPKLALLRVGEHPNDVAYETGIGKRCEKLGVAVTHVCLPETVLQEELLAAIDALNRDDTVHGCLLFRPLPAGFDETLVRNRVCVDKDVDGMTDGSLTGLLTGADKGFPPCTAQACTEILAYYGVDLTGKRAVVIGRSLVVGKPAALLLLAQNATVTVCHTKSVDLPAVCREAEVLIVAAGRAGVIGADCLTTGQTVIDVGIHVDAEGRLSGDVDFATAERIVHAITPVPGGVGTVTTSVLLKHVIEAAEKKRPCGRKGDDRLYRRGGVVPWEERKRESRAFLQGRIRLH